MESLIEALQNLRVDLTPPRKLRGEISFMISYGEDPNFCPKKKIWVNLGEKIVLNYYEPEITFQQKEVYKMSDVDLVVEKIKRFFAVN